MQKGTDETTANELANPRFARAKRIGFNFLNTRSGKPIFIKVLKYELRTNKQGETKPFWDALDLETGEEGAIYLDGGLKGQMASMGGPEKAVGMSLEILHKGLVEATITLENGKQETTEVNSYDVFQIQDA